MKSRELTHDQKVMTYNAMKIYGGGFVAALAEALIKADPKNERRICEAFPELIEKYYNIGSSRVDNHEEKVRVT